MKKFMKSPWTIGITTTFLGFLLTVIYDLVKAKQVFSTLKRIFRCVNNGIIAFLNLELKLWWILLGVAIILLGLYLCVKLSENNSSSFSKPDYISYTEDKFQTWKWSWEWELKSYDHKWHVTNLQAHCPKCDTPMVSDEYDSVYRCPRCGYYSGYGTYEKEYEVEAVIIDNIKRKTKRDISQK